MLFSLLFFFFYQPFVLNMYDYRKKEKKRKEKSLTLFGLLRD